MNYLLSGRISPNQLKGKLYHCLRQVSGAPHNRNTKRAYTKGIAKGAGRNLLEYAVDIRRAAVPEHLVQKIIGSSDFPVIATPPAVRALPES